MFLPRAQKTQERSQVLFIEKMVDVTVLMRTSPTANSRDASIQVPAKRQSGEHSSCATNSTETDADYQEDPEDC